MPVLASVAFVSVFPLSRIPLVMVKLVFAKISKVPYTLFEMLFAVTVSSALVTVKVPRFVVTT